MNVPSESQVTVAVARFLVAKGYMILGLALPGSGSGLVLQSDNLEFPPIVPDVVAKSPDGAIAVLEAKPRLHLPDAAKLILLRGTAYTRSVSTILAAEQANLILGLAFGAQIAGAEHLGPHDHEIDLILTVDVFHKVVVARDRKLGIGRGLGDDNITQ